MSVTMSHIRVAIVSVLLLLLSAAAPDTVRAADVWGCNYDKCTAYCIKVSGKNCSVYCERRLQDKRRDKVCK